MKYHISYQELIPHAIDNIEADSPSAAIKVLFSKFKNGEAPRIHNNGRADCKIINIIDEQKNEFAFFNHELKQWRWNNNTTNNLNESDSTNNKRNISNIIYKRRKELNLTLQEIGTAVGVRKSTVKRWETGEIKSISNNKIIKLAKILQINPIELIR